MTARRLTALLLILCAYPSLATTDFTLSRACSVLAEAEPDAAQVCRVRVGTTVDELDRVDAVFFRVRIGRCSGYLANSCLAVSSSEPAKVIARSTEISLSHRWLLSLTGGFDFSRAAVPYESNLTRGTGVSGLLQLHIPLGRFRLTPGVGYQNLFLSHSINGSGTIVDENPAPINQSLGYLTAQLLLSMRISGDGPTDLPSQAPLLTDNVYWLEAGAEYLYPVAAHQSVRDFPSESFASSDRPVLALLGMSVDFQLNRWLLAAGRVQLFYNATATAGSQYFGARFGVALMSTL